ncbi:MAG: FHA domain-containing protein [Deltaproteobacteria bacterium]
MSITKVKLRLSHPTVGEIAFPLPDGGQVVLGRRGGSTGVELNWDPKISRRHARVWVEGGRLWIEDLGSRNGTWHQGTRLTGPFQIEPGTRVRVGETGLENAEALFATGTKTQTLGGNVRLEDLTAPADDVESSLPHPASEDLELALDELQLPDLDGAAPLLDFAAGLDDAPRPTDVAPLPSESALAPAPSTPAPTPPDVRLIDGVVQVVLEDRDALERFWDCDLTKTGVFVPTDDPPQFGQRMTVEVATPDGVLKLSACVVHVVDPAMAARFGSPCGAGLQVVEVDPDVERRVRDYLDGARPILNATDGDAVDASRVDIALAASKRLIVRVEKNDLYAAIELAPDALQSEIDAKLGEIQSRLSGVTSDLSPPQAARLTPARKCLAQVVETLSTPERRLQFDFANGHVFAEKRLKAAADRTGPSVAMLRRAWRISHPRQVEQSQQLLRRAFEMRRSRAFDEALTLGKEALAKDPFWMELRRTIETWQALYNRDASAA